MGERVGGRGHGPKTIKECFGQNDDFGPGPEASRGLPATEINTVYLYHHNLGNSSMSYQNYYKSFSQQQIHSMRIGIYEDNMAGYDTAVAQLMYGLDSKGDINVPESIKQKEWDASLAAVFEKIKDDFASKQSGVAKGSFNRFINPIARAFWMSARASAVTTNGEAKAMIVDTGLEVGTSYVGRFKIPNPEGLNFNLLKERGSGNINGFSISAGSGYGAKPRLDCHALNYPSKKMNTLTLPESIKRNKIPILHYHRGRGNSLRIHRPFELDKNGKRVW